MANRIEALKMQEDEEEDVPQEADMPADSKKAAQEAVDHHHPQPGLAPPEEKEAGRKRSLSKMAKSAIFREVSAHIYLRMCSFGLSMLIRV